MAFTVHQEGTLEYLTAGALSAGGAVHAFSTRCGGVSEGPLSSLNLGTHRGDRPENVLENYRILGRSVGFSPEDTVFTRNLHTDIILRVAARPRALGCQPAAIRAALGPGSSRCCFETGPEVPEAMLAALGSEAQGAIEPRGDKFFVDLKALNRLHLLRAGVAVIDVSEDCTMCQPGRFWSHRASHGVRGSLAAVIMRKEETP